MIDKTLVALHFSASSATYDGNAPVQNAMAVHLMTLIREGIAPKRILEIGCGTGYLTAQLLQRFPDAAITAVDIAPGMIETMQNRFADAVNLRCDDAETMIFNDEFDLIISNASFQWFNDMPKTISRLSTHLASGAQLLFSTFGDGTFAELHQSFSAAAAQLQCLDAPPPGQRFLKANELGAIMNDPKIFSAAQISTQLYPQRFPSVINFLSSVKAVGAGNSNNRHSFNRALFSSMIDYYERHFRVGGEICATYRAHYVSGEK